MVKIENKKPEKSTLSKNGEDYELSFGEVNKGENKEQKLLLTSEKELESLHVRTSCGGCTKAKATKQSNKSYLLDIEYNTNLLGNINKSVYVYFKYVGENQEQKLNINLTGKCKN